MAQPLASHPLALPSSFSPDAIDALTELSLILSHLKPSTGANSASQGNAAASQTTSQTQPGTQPGTQPSDPSQPSNTHPLLPGVTNIGDLPLRDVAVGCDMIKHKLQRARQQVRLLPQMDRTIAEQEEEMAFMERRMAEQKKVLEMLKNVQLRSSEMEM